MGNENLWGIAEVKKHFKIGDHKAYGLMREKDFPSFRLLNKWYVIPSELHNWEIRQTRKCKI